MRGRGKPLRHSDNHGQEHIQSTEEGTRHGQRPGHTPRSTIDDLQSPPPVFDRCPRCDYSLRGLPANHTCPECGLRYDEHCELYRIRNPKAAFTLLLCVFGSVGGSGKGLEHFGHWATAGFWEKLFAVGAVVWLILIVFLARKLYRIYRRGQFVAVTADGLILRMVGCKDDLIPWERVRSVALKQRADHKAQTVILSLREPYKTQDVGGTYNFFPTRLDAERFLNQVNARIQTGTGAPPHPGAGDGDA